MRKKKETDPVSAVNGIRLAMTREQRDKLDEMCARDRRKAPDFIRLLIEAEWERRAAAAA